MTPLQICLRCDKRQRPCAGPCLCTVSGRDIRDSEGLCPLGYHLGATPPPGFDAQTAANRWPARGAVLWERLHTKAIAETLTADDVQGVIAELPANCVCECRAEAEKWVVANPLEGDLLVWSVRFHNDVNLRLGREEWSVDEAWERWSIAEVT